MAVYLRYGFHLKRPKKGNNFNKYMSKSVSAKNMKGAIDDDISLRIPALYSLI